MTWTERRTDRHTAPLTSASPAFPPVLSLGLRDSLPLHVFNRIESATGERLDVIFPKTGTSTGCPSGRRTGMLSLKFPRYRSRAESGPELANAIASAMISPALVTGASMPHDPNEQRRDDGGAEDDPKRGLR